MRYASVCSGVEAASLAWMPLGWEAVWFSEIEPFPCAVLKERFPDVPNLRDMTKIEGEKYRGTVDLLVGGTPCFVAGTMVLTPCGYKPIESLKIGDSVVTHTGNVRSITAIGSKEAQTGKVKILGRPSIRCTGNHPFYSIELKRDNKRNSSTYGQKVEYGEYEFKAVEDSVGRYAGRVTAKRIDGHIPNVYNATPEEIVELAGWYIGDGYIRRWNGKNKKAVIIAAVCKRKIDQFSKTFNGAIQYSVAKDGKITIPNTVLADWLIENFGEKSQSKKLPYWIYTSELNNRFIAGYEKTDGSRRANGNVRISTTSAALAYGMADLYGNASVGFCKRETPHVIMGRKVSQRDTYTVYKAKGKTARTKMLCGRYASIIRGWNNDGAIRTVYNIAVDGEHSYIVNGIAVHNCQGFSVAGKQGGINDPRSALCLSYCRLLETMRPRWFVWENVPGVFSTNGGEDFRAFLRKIDEIGYSCAWRVLDAQYVRVDGFPRAVPQRRRRVFVVGHLGGDWRYPASVLFEPGCLPGGTPPRRIKGEGVAADAKGSIRETGEGVAPDAKGGNNEAGSGVFWNGNDYADTLKANCDKDRMPDNGRLNCVIDTRCKNPNGSTLVMATGQANAEVSEAFSPALTCDHESPIVCGYETGQGYWQSGDIAGTLRAEGENRPSRPSNIICAGFSGGQGEKAGGIGYEDEVAPTIRSAESGSNQVPDVVCYENHDAPIAFRWAASPTQGLPIGVDYCHTLMANRNGEPAVCYENHAQDSRIKPCGECSPQTNAKAGTGGCNLPLVQAVAVAENIIGRKENTGANGTGAQVELAYTQNATGVMGVSVNTSVRRLLPVECERLMGFPDNWTRIPWRGKPAEDCPDSPRYKACGNSMCVNVMRWIGMRIEYVERKMNRKAGEE